MEKRWRKFEVCSSCGYKGGFHLIFGRKRGNLMIKLKCPSCAETFDIGWRCQL